MKRSRLSRGLQVMYLGVVVSILLVVALPLIQLALMRVTYTTDLTLLDRVVGVVVPACMVVGLALLWREHRGYRLTLVAYLASLVVGEVTTYLPLLAGATTVLSITGAAFSCIYIWLMIHTTNFFLRQTGDEQYTRMGIWVLIVNVIALAAAAAFSLPPILAKLSYEIVSAASTILVLLTIVGSILYLLYIVHTSKVLE